MNQLKVFNPKKVRDNIEKDLEASKDGAPVNTTFVIEAKEPPKGKTYKCNFFRNQIKLPEDAKPSGAILRLGDFVTFLKLDAKATAGTLTDEERRQYAKSYVEVTKGPRDPASRRDDEDEDDGKKGKDDGKPRKPNFATTVSKSGDFGFVIDHFDRVWVKHIESLRHGDNPVINEPKTHPLVQRKISPKNKNLDKEGKPLKNKPIEDPIIRLNLDFDRYPADYFMKFLAGKPRTEIYDFATMYTDAKGLPAFKPAVVQIRDPETGEVIRSEPPSDANVHKLIGRGTRVVDGRFHFDSTSESGFGVSSVKIAGRIVIDNRYRVDDNMGGETPEEFDEEALAAVAARVASSGEPRSEPRHTAHATPDVATAAPANTPVSDPNIDALISAVVGGTV